MKIKKVLFIDDGDITNILESLSLKLKRKGLDVEASIIDLKDHKFRSQNESEDWILDMSKIQQELDDYHVDIRYDAVACDFNFANDEINGYEVIKWLMNMSTSLKKRIRHAKFICYSSEEDKFQKNFLDSDSLIKLIKLKIEAFYKRDDVANDLAKLLSREDQVINMSLFMRDELLKFNYLKFQSVYPKFAGKTLQDIAHEIEENTHHGVKFQKDLIELTVAHILELNKTSS